MFASALLLPLSRPWILYWVLHALYLLDKEPTHLYPQVIETLQSMQKPEEEREIIIPGVSMTAINGVVVSDSTLDVISERKGWEGGFGGGPQQMPHGAPNYAAVLALCTVGTEEAFQSINRSAMYRFFLQMRDPVTGGYRIH